MMDYTLPIAKRTRLREAQLYRDHYENLKRKKIDNGADSASRSGVSGVQGDKVEEVCEKGRRNENQNLGFGCNLDSQSRGLKEQEEARFEVIGEEGGEDGDPVDFEVLNDLEANNVGSSTMGFKKVDGNDGDVVLMTEGNVIAQDFGDRDEKVEDVFDDKDLGDSSCTKVCGDKRGIFEICPEKFVNVNCDSIFEGNESCGIARRTASSLGSLEKAACMSNHGDVSKVDSDDSEMSSTNDDGDEEEEEKDNNDDDNDDEDYQVGKSEKFCISKWSSSSDGEEEEAMEFVEEIEVKKSGSDEKGKGSSDKIRLKKKAYGLEIVDLDNDENETMKAIDDSDNVRHEHDCVARRTRSRFNSELIKKNLKLGTISCPLSVDEKDSDSSSLHSDNSDESDNGNVSSDGTYNYGLKSGTNSRKAVSNGKNDNEYLEKLCRKGDGDLGKSTKRKGICALKDHDVVKILLGSILNEKIESVSSGDVHNGENSKLEITLPLKFEFGVHEQNPSEKSGYGKELDELWAEMEFSLRSCEIGFTETAMVAAEDSVPSEVEPSTTDLCRQGIHQLILDEQIGLICKHCSFVNLEIRYIVPEFCPDYWERLGRRESDTEKHSIFDEIGRHDPEADFDFGCRPCVHSRGTVWDIIPGIKDGMYPHQCEGFEFIWKNIAGGIFLDELKNQRESDGGTGCIISHAPGTGKSRLTIVFLQTYLALYPTCRPVIVAPRSMLLTWEEEFRKWKVNIPFHNLNKPEFSGEENRLAVSLVSQLKYGARSVHTIRMAKLYSWKKDRSILGISYRLFETLTRKDKKRKTQRASDEEQVREILLDLPGLFIFDEGHTPRNDQSDIWKDTLSNIKTERRIILSGTPFQNNFDELYNTLCLVRPKFADMISSANHIEISKRRGCKRDQAKGKWASLTSSIGKFDNDIREEEKLKKVKAMIAPFVHIHKGTILQESLPGLKHSLVILQPQHLQKNLLEGLEGIRNIIYLNLSVSLASVHPSLFSECFFEKDKIDVDEDELKMLRMKPEAGIKTKFLMEFLRLCEAMNERVLVFGQYVEPLTLIRDQLKLLFNWTEGKEVLYMDGKREIKQRQSSINTFNDPKSEARVLLASTRACSEGINLVGASRVVLLDVAWNPSVERQAISRAYRLGQKKVVYVYHLITSGTMEEEKSLRQAGKDRVSELVFSSSKGCSNQHKIVSSSVAEDKVLEAMVQHDELKYMFKDVIFQSKESSLIDTFDLVNL